jgi:vancomycin permeability regulator SanA
MNTGMKAQLASFFRGPLPRGLALFLGVFSLLNTLGSVRFGRFDATLWWLNLRFLPAPVASLLILSSSLLLIALGIRMPRSNWRRSLTAVCVTVLMAVATWNTIEFYILLTRGAMRTHFPLPLSGLLAVGLGLILKAVLERTHPQIPEADPAAHKHLLGTLLWPETNTNHRNTGFIRQWPRTNEALAIAAVVFGCTVCFPLAQMLCFGKTDYRRPADAVVVLGARVYADGRPSDALADRVRTGCRLYLDGLARKLILSGGPGDGPVTEPQAMKKMAVQCGVRPDDILLDERGLNTQATVRNTEAIFSELHASRILVVSHFYHLPRIKLAYQREGWEVYTVPAKESYLLRQMPYNMAREVAAFWAYYLRPQARA